MEKGSERGGGVALAAKWTETPSLKQSHSRADDDGGEDDESPRRDYLPQRRVGRDLDAARVVGARGALHEAGGGVELAADLGGGFGWFRLVMVVFGWFGVSGWVFRVVSGFRLGVSLVVGRLRVAAGCFNGQPPSPHPPTPPPQTWTHLLHHGQRGLAHRLHRHGAEPEGEHRADEEAGEDLGGLGGVDVIWCRLGCRLEGRLGCH